MSLNFSSPQCDSESQFSETETAIYSSIEVSGSPLVSTQESEFLERESSSLENPHSEQKKTGGYIF